MTLVPFAAWAGPKRPKMLLVGEAWGEHEEAARQPFVGWSGQELWKMLGEAAPDLFPEAHARATNAHRYGPAWIRSRAEWLDLASISFTNVFNLHPPGNNLDHLCVPKKQYELLLGERSEGPSAFGPIPPLTRNPHLYLHPQHLPELLRLRREISLSRPNLIVALGATATWALLRASGIGSIRGAVADCSPVWESPVDLGGGFGAVGADAVGPYPKILPTYHPAGVLRNWAWRSIVVADFIKAFREAEYPEIRRPKRQVLVNPSLSEISEWAGETLAPDHPGLSANPPRALACDIETKSGQISCIGFARSATQSIVIPFLAPSGASYWPTLSEELQAWNFCNSLLASPAPKVFQNGLYDIQYLLKMGFRITNPLHDTMLLHHSLHPELLKGLGFLGSIYTSEASWKLMRRKKDESNKADD